MVDVKIGTRPPWVGLAAAVWVQLAAANAYTFPLYSGTLKYVLGYGQQQLTMLGVAVDIGQNFGIIPGVLCNWLPPWLILAAGATMCFLGCPFNMPLDYVFRTTLYTCNGRRRVCSTWSFPLHANYGCGVGSGVTALNNLAQIGYAAGVNDTTVLLCLFSLGNFFGRLGGGAVSEHLVKSRMLPRPVLMTCTQIIMVISFLFLSLALDRSLYISTGFLGICYGVQYSVMIPTVSELFGLKNFGLFYNFMSLGNPIGAFLFSGLLAGYLYDKEMGKQVGTTCLGQECFRVTFLILGGLCAFGAFLSVILSVRIRPVYQMLYAGGSFRVNRPLH
ncbi:hypothetical protein LUZ60_002985 [Juncus effusus]|nr:hypothetical protein LUZ60_002985 [Juncus effusus]